MAVGAKSFKERSSSSEKELASESYRQVEREINILTDNELKVKHSEIDLSTMSRFVTTPKDGARTRDDQHYFENRYA